MRATRFLCIAGTDPSGGAGQSADLKTASALGAYATSVLTAVVAQNTCGVRSVLPLPENVIRAQLDAVFEDIDIDCVKIGMVSDLTTARLIREFIERYRPAHVVLDPVMVAKSGDMLVDREGFHAVRDVLIPIADVITPNLPEAAVLLESDIPASHEEMAALLPGLSVLGADTVVLKGGYLHGETSNDLVHTPQGNHWLEAPRIETRALHGSGCTLASAIAALLPRHDTPIEAIRQAKTYMTQALTAAERLDIGKGQGPVHHFHAWW
ncbi:hydroxymethylpyrimidine/phosphomethylpyrimidine kinase [Kushneria pakistanensis]|uniref:hydroxymethylpyrimidine kinase n=1 Tax=Kushneria pakistanensis TaxID=1508770 RepID=A0ABQ3FIC2_9GAMM|nr:bifunctional hydroxymethylpyrimidine kinase/phosphomethylpyrimidine kinase [Kushneria pakistanensis]GHC24714.1 hydroxymethylpyrimidine/phosphomethylpyrimidine kinase [Kushneria pakistanensis]